MLDVVAGKATGFSITVDQQLVIGRQSEGPGCLADDLELSRHHAEISCGSSGEYTIKDLSSTNGTFVNGERLNAPAVLHAGDAIEVGGTTLAVRAAPGVPPPVTTPPVDLRARTVAVEVPATMRESEPAAPPVSEPEAPPLSEPEAPPLPVLELRVAFDIERAEARITLNESGEAVRVRLDAGRWQLSDSAPDG